MHLRCGCPDLGCFRDCRSRDAGLKTSRLTAATPYEILTFVGRGTSVRDHDRLKAGLDRLQSTTVLTSIRQPAERRRHRFSWINEWKETFDANGRPFGLGMRPRLRSLAVRESTGVGVKFSRSVPFGSRESTSS